MFKFQRSRLATWRDKRDYLKALKEQMRDYSQAVPGLAPILKKEYDQEFESLSLEVQQGAVAEFQQSVESFKLAARKKNAADTREKARWSLPQLLGEMQAIRSLVDGVISQPDNLFTPGDKGGELHKLYDEFMAGDLTRQRAAAEIFSKLPDTLPAHTASTSANDGARKLSFAAKQKLAEIRTTDEMAAAEAARIEAKNALLQKREELLQVGRELGVAPTLSATERAEGFDPTGGAFNQSPILKAYRSIVPMDDDVQILPPDDWRLTGVYDREKEESQNG